MEIAVNPDKGRVEVFGDDLNAPDAYEAREAEQAERATALRAKAAKLRKAAEAMAKKAEAAEAAARDIEPTQGEIAALENWAHDVLDADPDMLTTRVRGPDGICAFDVPTLLDCGVKEDALGDEGLLLEYIGSTADVTAKDRGELADYQRLVEEAERVLGRR